MRYAIVIQKKNNQFRYWLTL